MDFSWMGWTWPTAAFFAALAAGLVGMSMWDVLSPSTPRTGIFGNMTSRGDRFFVSVIGSMLIELGWIGIVGGNYATSAIICLLFAAAVFRWY